MPAATLLTQFEAHSRLSAIASSHAAMSVSAMLEEDACRPADFSLEAAGLHLDYSKQLLSREARDELFALAGEAKLGDAIAALINGAEVNNTEARPALHTLLRARSAPGLEDKLEAVEATRSAMQEWSGRLNSGQQRGFSGATITDVVNIGIGGSDLGPRLVNEALRPFHGDVACHYVANVDPADLQNTLLELAPETTLFIICSKSFRTQETLANSLVARQWIRAAGASEADLNQHFLAITSNLQAAAEFGIADDNCLPMWDWVGGRFSVWSAIGLSCAIAVGWDNFAQFLEGAAAMDRHFTETPLQHNMPVVMSLLEIWYTDFFACNSHVVLPYDNSLATLPDFLQQLTMESNGKRVTRDGSACNYATAPVLWGAAGTIGQHSFHQLLHQGTPLCPADFIIPLTTHTGMHEQHRQLVANGLAQSRTLMVGRSRGEAEASLLARGVAGQRAIELAPHLAMPGNRPNSVITMQAVTPATLGALLALYEHRTYCSGVLWGINSFDQWGVELGKEISGKILDVMANESSAAALDPATDELISRWRRAQRQNQ